MSDEPKLVLPAQEAAGLTWSGEVVVTDGFDWGCPIGRATLFREADGGISADIRWRPGHPFASEWPDEKLYEFGYGKAGDRIMELAVVPIEFEEAHSNG